MKNSSIYYSVGPLLYCPANRDTIAASIIRQQFGTQFSLALCLEDTISDTHVAEAEQCLAASLLQIRRAMEYILLRPENLRSRPLPAADHASASSAWRQPHSVKRIYYTKIFTGKRGRLHTLCYCRQ